jgi:hypothetical protein
MRWLNPAALVGLLALAVPVLVHLFGRRIARRQRFPSLRLLRDARATPATRSQPSDILLLLLRCAVIAAAALALAQPLWLNAIRTRAANTPVRAIMVDTSLSMRRLTSEGGAETALERARALAQQMLDSSREGLVIETDRPGASIAGASSWLAVRSGLREIVIVSDFQEGAVQDGNLFAVPPGVGVRPLRVAATSSGPAPPGPPSGLRVAAWPLETEATWDVTSRDSLTFPLTILPAPTDDEAVLATIAAARRLRPAGRTSHNVTVLFPGSASATAAGVQERTLAAPWQGDLLLALRRNRLLRDVAARATATSCAVTGTPILHNDRREPLAMMAAAVPGVPGEAVIASCVAAGSIAAVALVSAVVSALSTSSFAELEPSFVPDEHLRRWERPPTSVVPRGTDETSPDGRWFWVVALLLLLAEEWVRRRSPRRSVDASLPTRDERVA